MRANIEAERARLCLTKAEIAKQIEVSDKTFARYVNGYPIPSNKLLELTRLFNCSADYLLEEKERKK